MDSRVLRQIEKFKKIKESEPIPYYASYFERQEELLCSYCELIEKDQNLNVFKLAELQTILQGIRYYYDVIMSGKQSDADRKRCNKLVESTNRVICLMQDESSESDNFYHICFSAYREYLQEICNAFRVEHNGTPSLIFSFALDRMSGKVHMDSLFTQIYESSHSLPDAFLSAVFVPMDRSIGDVFKYLPMLTHEASHNFKYSETPDRNAFIVKYMSDKMASHIVRRLLMQKADGKYGVFIGGAEDAMSAALSDALVKEVSRMEPSYMEEGHLDYLPSLLYSILTGSLRSREKMGDYFQIGESKFDILRKAVLGLANQSNWNWYLMGKEEVSDRMEKEILASLFVDIISAKDIEQLQWYRDLTVEDSCRETIEQVLTWYEDDKICLSAGLIVPAVEEILLSAMERIRDDFPECFQEEFTNAQEAKEVLLSLADDQKKFQLNLDQLVDKTGCEDKQTLYAFADRCIAVKNNVNSIELLRRISGGVVEKKDASDDTIVRMYKTLQETVKKELSGSKHRLYLTVRDSHAILIKLGLLSEEKPEYFGEIYKEMLHNWGESKIYAALEEYLAVYREIFADLSMCAVFQFTQMGYFRYLAERFEDVGEMSGQFSRNMALDRVQKVWRVLDDEYPKAEFEKQYREKGLEVECVRKWKDVIETYINEDINDENKSKKDADDERYLKVYKEKIVTAGWVKALRKDKMIRAIGAYYNEWNLSEEKRNEISQCFLKQYVEKANRREELYKIGNLDPISAILEDIADEDK